MGHQLTLRELDALYSALTPAERDELLQELLMAVAVTPEVIMTGRDALGCFDEVFYMEG